MILNMTLYFQVRLFIHLRVRLSVRLIHFWLLSFTETLVYIGASLGVVVLFLAIVLLIFFRYRKRQINKFSGLKPTNKTNADCMHSNNPSDPPIRPDDVTYCPVTFKDTRAGCDSTTLHPADVTYSVLIHTSTDDATVYSNVWTLLCHQVKGNFFLHTQSCISDVVTFWLLRPLRRKVVKRYEQWKWFHGGQTSHPKRWPKVTFHDDNIDITSWLQ